MKKILYSFLIVFVAIVSCEQEEFPGSGLESLRDFTLTPVPNSRIALNSLAPDEEISITWQQARSGFDSPVTYTWMFDEAGGDFSNPLISLPSDNDGMDPKITFTNAELEAALADAAVSAGSEIHGIWAVRATNGDVTKTSASNVLAMMRYSEAVMTFDLIGPETNRTVFLKEAQADEDLQISWEATVSGIGTPITYNVIFDEVDGDFSDPVLSLESDDDGAASTLTKTQAEVEDLLAGIGVDEKSKIDLKWTVVATAGEVTQMANEPFNITLVRWGTELRLFIENVPDLAPSGKEIFAAGSFGFLGNGTVDWQTPGSNPALQLSKNEADGTYYLDINVPKGTSFEYKFALATTASPTWDNGEQQLNAANDGCEGIANRQFTFDGTQDVVSHTVVSWERFCPFDVVELIFELKSYPEIPAGYDVYMAGSFGDLGAFGTWNQPGTNPEFKMTKGEDNVYRKTFLVSKAQATSTVYYKYFLVPEGGSSWDHGEQSFSSDGCQGLHGGAEGDNRKYTYSLGDGAPRYVESNVVTWQGFCLEDAAPRARIEVTVPEVPAGKDVYITGELLFAGASGFNSVWKQPGTNPAFRMRPVANETDKFEIYLPFKEDTEVKFKFFLATTESPSWGSGEQKFNATEDGCEGAPDRSFTFDGTNEYVGTVEAWEGFCPF